jgi:hypothetical protein
MGDRTAGRYIVRPLDFGRYRVMTASTFRAIGVLAILTTEACVKDFRNGRPDLMQPTKVANNGASNRDNEGFGHKPVHGKATPRRLIARDGTSCVVSQKKFDSATVGTSVWCTWFDADR